MIGQERMMSDCIGERSQMHDCILYIVPCLDAPSLAGYRARSWTNLFGTLKPNAFSLPFVTLEISMFHMHMRTSYHHVQSTTPRFNLEGVTY